MTHATLLCRRDIDTALGKGPGKKRTAKRAELALQEEDDNIERMQLFPAANLEAFAPGAAAFTSCSALSSAQQGTPAEQLQTCCMHAVPDAVRA